MSAEDARICLSPQERVKNGAACIRLQPNVVAGAETTSRRPLTDFGRRRPNLPLPLERVKSRGASGWCCFG